MLTYENEASLVSGLTTKFRHTKMHKCIAVYFSRCTKVKW